MCDALERSFGEEIKRRLIDRITVEPDVVIVAIVGEGMRGTPGIAARLFSALGEKRVNVIAVAQGSSETNISLALAAERRRCRAFGISTPPLNLSAGSDRVGCGMKRVPLIIFGAGKVGRALVRQLLSSAGLHGERDGVALRIAAWCDRDGAVVDEKGLWPGSAAHGFGRQA